MKTGSHLSDDEARRLRAMLEEDSDSPEDVEALLPIVSQLKRWPTPEIKPEKVARLMAVLLPEMTNGESHQKRWRRLVSSWWPLLLIRSQIRVVRGEIWTASALVMMLGMLVTLTSYIPVSGGLIPLAALAPVVAACGVALLYDSDVEHMLELEDATAASARLLLLARLALVFGFDLGLGFAASAILAVLRPDLSLWPLVMSWLAPMAFLSSLAFLLSTAFFDAVVGAVFSLALWGLHIMFGAVTEANQVLYILSLPGLGAVEMRPLLFACAAALVAVALWVAGNNERRLGART